MHSNKIKYALQSEDKWDMGKAFRYFVLSVEYFKLFLVNAREYISFGLEWLGLAFFPFLCYTFTLNMSHLSAKPYLFLL